MFQRHDYSHVKTSQTFADFSARSKDLPLIHFGRDNLWQDTLQSIIHTYDVRRHVVRLKDGKFTGHTPCQCFHGSGYFHKHLHYTFALYTYRVRYLFAIDAYTSKFIPAISATTALPFFPYPHPLPYPFPSLHSVFTTFSLFINFITTCLSFPPKLLPLPLYRPISSYITDIEISFTPTCRCYFYTSTIGSKIFKIFTNFKRQYLGYLWS